MDGTITSSRFAVELARTTGHETELMQLLDGHDDSAARSDRIANLFRFVHKREFERVARSLDIRPGVIEFVNQMRRRGFMVGVVSDSYFVAAEIIRRRIFADFAMAHTMQFDGDVCAGEIRINPAFLPKSANTHQAICKSNVLRCFLADGQECPPAIKMTWVIGDNVNDLELMRLADKAFVIDPKSPVLLSEPGVAPIASFKDLLELLPNHVLVEAESP
jgi:phosphoserine phosphatase